MIGFIWNSVLWFCKKLPSGKILAVRIDGKEREVFKDWKHIDEEIPMMKDNLFMGFTPENEFEEGFKE